MCESVVKSQKCFEISAENTDAHLDRVDWVHDSVLLNSC